MALNGKRGEGGAGIRVDTVLPRYQKYKFAKGTAGVDTTGICDFLTGRKIYGKLAERTADIAGGKPGKGYQACGFAKRKGTFKVFAVCAVVALGFGIWFYVNSWGRAKIK